MPVGGRRRFKMKRMRKLEDVLAEMLPTFDVVDKELEDMEPKNKVEFIAETNMVQREWIKQAVEEGYLNFEQGFKMLTYNDHDIQMSVMDQLDRTKLHQLFQIAYELIDSSYLKLSQSKKLFEACLDAYRKVYF